MENDYLGTFTSILDLKRKNYAKMYAESVSKLHDPSAEIEWLFSKLPREEQDSLVEIFNLNFQDNE